MKPVGGTWQYDSFGLSTARILQPEMCCCDKRLTYLVIAVLNAVSNVVSFGNKTQPDQATDVIHVSYTLQ